METREQIKLIESSTHLDSTWYRHTYPDVAALGIAPAEHYLRYGAIMGRDPGKTFSTKKYLAKHSEIAQGGTNPLVHYELQGNELFDRSHLSKDDVRSQLVVIRRGLLSSESVERSLGALTRLSATSSDRELRALAARELAVWHMRDKSAKGYRAALGFIAKARNDALGLAFRARLSVAELLCLYHLGDAKGGHAAFQRASLAGEVTPDATRIFAHLQPTEPQRAAWLGVLGTIDLVRSRSIFDLERALRFDLTTEALASGVMDFRDVKLVELCEFFKISALPAAETAERSELVSLMIPSFNNDSHLIQAIHSALSQRDVNLEIIVVDDGSSDASLDVALEAKKNDPRVTVVPLVRNFGCYYARNVALMHAKGEYLAFLDSDDILHPERLHRQLTALKSRPEAVACLCQLRRWTADFSEPISQKKFGENGLLFRRELLEKVGFFDSVRFGGDSEYRRRIESALGSNSILRLDEELYHLRTLETSLTMSAGSEAYEATAEGLVVKLSPKRSAYAKAFSNWHKTAQATGAELYMPFPLRHRPFDIPDESQNASPVLNEMVTGTMATFPARETILERTIRTILPQVDRLIIYLNGYERVPEYLVHEKVQAIVGRDAAGDLRDNGKFFSHNIQDGFVFTFDDDLFYPPDYVQRHIFFQERFNRCCVTGVHGVIYPAEKLGYMEGRVVYHFKEESKLSVVDSLGTGTVCFHSSLLKPEMADFITTGICDLWFAVKCHEHDIPLLSIARPRDWISEAARHEQVSRLYDEAKSAETKATELYHRYLYPILDRKRPRDSAINRLRSSVGRHVVEEILVSS